MRKILGFLACLLMLITAGNVLAAGYTCPTYKKYTSCKSGYYISNCPTSSSSWTGQTISSSSLTTGNSCKACPTGYTCSGGLVCPKAKTVTVTYNLNGGFGTGTRPTSKVCTYGSACSLQSGATTSFYRAGYVFKGWSTNKSATTGSTSMTFTANTTVYAIWTACAKGTFKGGSGTQASATCTSVSSGYYATNCSSSGNACTGQSQCTGATYCSSGVKYDCPGSYTANTTAGKTSASQCEINVSAGKYIATANSSTQSTCGTGTYKVAHTVKYGSTSSCTSCPEGYQDGAGTTSQSNCEMHITAGYYLTSPKGTTLSKCSAGTYKAAHTVTYGATPPTCSACTGRTKYSAAGAGSCSTVSSGYYTTGCNTSGNNCTGQTQCTGATYCTSGVQNNCPAQTSGWTRATGTGWTSYTSCYQTKSGTAISSYCSSGTLKQTATSSTTWGATTISSALSAKAGAYVNGQTCTQCNGAVYSAGGTATSCTSCPAQTTGWTRATGTGWTSYTSCYQTKAATAVSSYCSSGTLKQTATSSSAWGATTISSALSAKAGAYVNGQTCTQCSGATYSAGGTATSCTSCPAQTSGWTRATGTGWTSYTSCYQTKSGTAISSYCSSGTLKQTATSSTTWGATTISSALSAKAGAYVNGQTCTQCTSGYYCTGGTTARKACSTLANGFYPNSAAGSDAETDCYTANLKGQYVASAKATSATNCAAGTYKGEHKVNYGSTSSCSACTGATYSGAKAPSCTNCPENYDANLASNKTSINQCQISVKEDFFIKIAGDTVATQCPAGYINEAELVNYNSTSECDAMEYTITLNKNGGTGTINGATGTTNATQTCKHGELCNLPDEGLTKENFTFTGWGTSASCTSGATQMTFTGATTIYACWSQNTTQCQAGKYYDGTSHIECPSGKYCPGTGYANEGQPGCASTCPAGYSGSDKGASKNTSCYKTCGSKPITGGTTTVVNSKVYYTGTAYPACTYNVNCNAGYVAANGGSTSPSCNRCVDGQYCPGGSSEEEPDLCPVGSYCPAGIKTACPDSGTSALGAGEKSECYKTFNPYSGFQNGTASAKCFYNISGSAYTTCSIVNVSGCDAGYWYNGTTEFACNDVLNGYYSPEGSKTQTACPVAPDGSQVSSSENAASYTDCYMRCELEVDHSSLVKPAADFVYGISADEYKACKFGVVCNTGYTVNGNNTSAPSCQANVYTITLNKNGGTGTVSDSIDCVFDSQSCELPDTSSMVRPGYTVGAMWCSDADGGEPCYEGGINITENISATGTDITLYAVWTPNVYKITLDDNSADSASVPGEIYLKYATDWFSDESAMQPINKLSVLPKKTGYELGGYYSAISGGIQIINSDGVLQKNTSALQMTTAPATIYARWSAGLTTCQAGTYYTGNGTSCLTCPENNYCPGGEFATDTGTPAGIVSCATLDKGDYKYSANGASAATQCYRSCEAYDIINGTAIPIRDSEYYPDTCQFRGESETGNPCEIKDGVCLEKVCNSDYEMKNGICVPCDREFALSYKPDGNCRVASCVAGYHPKDKECVPDVLECYAPNATYAEQKWNYSTNSFGLCTVKECESGYHIASNACVSDMQPCEFEHGTGFKEWNYKNQRWGECIATACEPGYTNDPSETNDRVNQCGECKNKYGRNGNIVVSSYVQGCEIAACMYQGELYALENNECIQICPVKEYEDETGTMVWDEGKKKCVRTCKAGYIMW